MARKLFFGIGLFALSIKMALGDVTCKQIYTDDWFVADNAQPVQMLAWHDSDSGANDIIFYRSHELMIFQYKPGEATPERESIYFDANIFPKNISGIALDQATDGTTPRLIVAFNSIGTGGTDIWSYDWKQVQAAIDKDPISPKSLTIDDSASDHPSYDAKKYQYTGGAGGAGRIDVGSDHGIYVQYNGAGRGVGFWDKDRKTYSWVDGTSKVYRSNFIVVDQGSSDHSFYAYVDAGTGHTQLIHCTNDGGCKDQGPIDTSKHTVADDYIPFLKDGAGGQVKLMLSSIQDKYADYIKRSIWTSNPARESYDIKMPWPDLKDSTEGLHTGVSDVKQLGNTLYVLASFFWGDESNPYSPRALGLYQCDISGVSHD